MRILVVEDDLKTASFIRKALREEGFAVDVSHSGDDALQLSETTPYDALVLDIMLPGRDGLSVLRRLRERRNLVPVLLLSARGEEPHRRGDRPRAQHRRVDCRGPRRHRAPRFRARSPDNRHRSVPR